MTTHPRRSPDPLPVLGAALLSSVLLGSALAQAPTAALPAGWSSERLSSATYLILEPQVQGNLNLISGGDQATVLRAMKKDSGDALKRRYPQATILRDEALSPADAIRVTPGLSAPSALLPWAKLSARLTLAFPEGQQVEVNEQFSVLTLWQHRYDAANYAFDQVALRLP